MRRAKSTQKQTEQLTRTKSQQSAQSKKPASAAAKQVKKEEPALEKRRSRSSQQTKEAAPTTSTAKKQPKAPQRKPSQPKGAAAAAATAAAQATKSTSPPKNRAASAKKAPTKPKAGQAGKGAEGPAEEETKAARASTSQTRKTKQQQASVSPTRGAAANTKQRAAAPATKKPLVKQESRQSNKESAAPVQPKTERAKSSSQLKSAAVRTASAQGRAEKAPVTKKPLKQEPAMKEEKLPKVDVKVQVVKQEDTPMEIDVVAKVETQQMPIDTKMEPVGTLNSRFDLEQEIERQFAPNVKRDSSFDLNITKGRQSSLTALASSQPAARVNDTRFQELKRKFDGAGKSQYKFTPTLPHGVQGGTNGKSLKAKVRDVAQTTADHLISLDQIVKQEGLQTGAAGDPKDEQDGIKRNAVDELANLPQQQTVNRKTSQQRQQEALKAEANKPQRQFGLTSAVGGPSGAKSAAQGIVEGKKKEKKVSMNDQNWQLAQSGDPDAYFPSQLPFFNPGESKAKEAESSQVQESPDKLSRARSHVSGADLEKEFVSGQDLQVDRELCDMLYDKKMDEVAMSEQEPMLLQLPGSLPFAEVKPHSATALEEMIERLGSKSQGAPSGAFKDDDESMGSSMNALGSAPAPKIGKLRIHKGGKVVMRLQLPGQQNYVDLELNEGIKTNFYQELVAVDAEKESVHFLAKVQTKLVATPDLDSILNLE